MSEIIKVKNASYTRYEELLIKRDQYEREAESLLIAYTKEFGDLTVRIFEEKVECVSLKKTISYCQAALNRGMPIELAAIKAAIHEEMALYREELEALLKRNQDAREAKTASIVDIERSKKLYRRLAKRLHPDINPLTDKIPELSDLWNRIVIAYKRLDPRELTDLEVLVNKVIEELGLDAIEVEIPDIEERILLLEEEINEILTTEPYTYGELLDDPEAVEELRGRLEADLKETIEYRNSLEEMLQNMLAGSGVSVGTVLG